MKTLEEIYEEASKFVEEKFETRNENQKRISILAVMKQIIDLERMKKE